MSETKQPDWDKITEGKIRHGFAVSAFANGMEMTDELCQVIEKWVRYVVEGQVSIGKPIEEKKSNPNNVFNKIVDSLEVIEEDKTDDDYIADIIKDKVKSLSPKDSERVLESLNSGKINKENLDVCLQKIEVLAKKNGE